MPVCSSAKMMLVSCQSVTWSANGTLSTACGMDGIASVSHRGVSNGLSNNSSPPGASGAFTTQPRQAKCQVVLLLLGGLGTENRKGKRFDPSNSRSN